MYPAVAICSFHFFHLFNINHAPYWVWILGCRLGIQEEETWLYFKEQTFGWTVQRPQEIVESPLCVF